MADSTAVPGRRQAAEHAACRRSPAERVLPSTGSAGRRTEGLEGVPVPDAVHARGRNVRTTPPTSGTPSMLPVRRTADSHFETALSSRFTVSRVCLPKPSSDCAGAICHQSGHYGLVASVVRGGRHFRLLLSGPAADAVEALACAIGGTVESLCRPVFCVRGSPGRRLSYQAARDVLQDACRRAGLPPVESTALRAACAHWLRSQGLSDHEIAAVLGLAWVRSVDRLLQHHAALDAQRVVREMLDRC